MNQVKLVSVTPDAEKLMAYCARVSNPNNQTNENYAKLLKYCIDHQHWSIFEHGFMTVEINTTRGLAAQILRHRSFTFQEFSQRYADATLLGDDIQLFELRRQDNKNRQNSIETDDVLLQQEWEQKQQLIVQHAKDAYDWAIEQGIAKEQARAVLPEGLTVSRLYVNGTLRSWIHYIDLRDGNGTQKEHAEIARACAEVIAKVFPIIKSIREGI